MQTYKALPSLRRGGLSSERAVDETPRRLEHALSRGFAEAAPAAVS